MGCREGRGSGGGPSAVVGISPAARHEEDLPFAQHRLARPHGGRRAAQLGGLQAGVEDAVPLVERDGRGDRRAVVARGDAGRRPAGRREDPLLGSADDGVPCRRRVRVDMPAGARAGAADDLTAGGANVGACRAALGRVGRVRQAARGLRLRLTSQR
jgi:hypothetical protein